MKRVLEFTSTKGRAHVPQGSMAKCDQYVTMGPSWKFVNQCHHQNLRIQPQNLQCPDMDRQSARPAVIAPKSGCNVNS